MNYLEIRCEALSELPGAAMPNALIEGLPRGCSDAQRRSDAHWPLRTSANQSKVAGRLINSIKTQTKQQQIGSLKTQTTHNLFWCDVSFVDVSCLFSDVMQSLFNFWVMCRLFAALKTLWVGSIHMVVKGFDAAAFALPFTIFCARPPLESVGGPLPPSRQILSEEI